MIASSTKVSATVVLLCANGARVSGMLGDDMHSVTEVQGAPTIHRFAFIEVPIAYKS